MEKDGKISSDDEGIIEFKVSVQHNLIIIEFFKRISWLSFTKEEALKLAGMLEKFARNLKIIVFILLSELITAQVQQILS